MTDHWPTFYQDDKAPHRRSAFAVFCAGRFQKLDVKTVLDMGCGNGRDSYYLAVQGYTVHGVDRATRPQDRGAATFSMTDAIGFLERNASEYDAAYCRFFLHAISADEQARILAAGPRVLAIEARAVGDEPRAFRDHARRFIDPGFLKMQLLEAGYVVRRLHVGYGMARFPGEDPRVVRAIATRP